MPLDFSIYDRFKAPQPDFNGLNNALLQMGQMRRQTQEKNKLQEALAAKDYRSAALLNPQAATAFQQFDQQDALSKAYGQAVGPDGRFDSAKLFPALAQAGQGHQIPEIQKNLSQQQKAAYESEAAKLKVELDKIDVGARYLGAVKDEASYQAAVRQVSALGIDMSDAPPTYDPAWVQSEVDQALTAKDRFDQWVKAQGLQLDQAKFTEQRRHHQAQEGLTARGQDLRGNNGLSVTLPDGTVVQQGGQPMKLTEQQSKDVGFYTRGLSASTGLDAGEGALTSLRDRAVSGVPGVGNYLVSPEYQQANQAGREFLAAILRKDTGAAITNQEMDIYGKMYLPQPGDSPETLRQKREARGTALDALRLGLGTAQGLTQPRVPSEAQAPATQPTLDDLLAKYGAK